MQQKIRRIKKILISFLVCCVLVLETPSLLLAEESTGEIPVSETAEDTADETVDTPQEPQPSAEPTPTVTQEPEPTPQITQEPTPTPQITQEPTPTVTQEPELSAEPTPQVTQEPMEAPEVQESIQGKAPASATGWKKAENGR